MARFDVLFSESHTTTTHRNNTATTSANASYAVEGFDVTVSALPSLAFVEGQIVAVTGGSPSRTAYCRITRVQTSSKVLTLLPLQTVLDSSGLTGHTFTSGASVTSSIATPIRAATLVVDLTEAPFSSAKYLIAASGNLTVDTASATAGACLRTSALVGDPYSGTGRDVSTGLGPSQTSITWDSTAELAPFMGSAVVTLSGGQRYEFAVEFWSATANVTATFDECAIMAVRCDTVYTTTSSAETTSSSTTAVSQCSLSTLPAGKYLVVGTWALGCSNTAVDTLADLDVGITGSAAVRSRLTLRSTSDYVSCGQMFVVDVPASNAVSLSLYSGSNTANAKMRNGILTAVPIPRGFDFAYVASPSNVTTVSTTAIDTDVTVQTGSASLAHAGRAIQVISSDVGTTTSSRTRWRALTSAGTKTPLAHGMVWGTASTSRHSTFFLYRQSLPSGSTSVELQGRSPNTASTTLTARRTSLSWLLERADMVVLPNSPTSIVVDLENGGLLLKTWAAAGSAFRKHLPVATGISRVLGPSATAGGGVEYAKVTSTGSLTSGTWYWDAAAQDVYVYLATSGTPADADKQVVVIPQLLISRDHEDLVSDEDGVTFLPYDARIDSVPGMTQELVSNDGRWEVSTSLGSLTLAAADGLLDDPLVQHYYDGIRARVRRGWSTLSNRLGDFDVVADALVGMPDTDFQKVTFKLFDRGLNLTRPVATATATVKEGNTTDASEATRETQPLPVIYGTVKRVPAYRVETIYGSGYSNKFQIAGASGHALADIVAVYLDETTSKAVASADISKTTALRNAGQVSVKNDAFADSAKPQDVVYVDVVGRTASTTDATATAITTPGSIARDLLTTYGGLAATDLIEPSFRLLDRAWRKQLVVSPYGFKPVAPSVGFLIEGDEDAWSALLRLCGDVGAYPYVSRTGRIGVGVVDMDAPNLLDNGGFEYGDATSWVRSWSPISSATMKVATARKYDGTSSLEASNGNPTPSATARVEQTVILPTPGSYVVSCLASSLGGEPAAFRLGCYLPDGTEALSEPFLLSSLQWTRCTFPFETSSGSAGSARVRIYPAYGSTTATTIAVDNIELLPVAFVGDDGNTLAASLEFREDTFYEVAVTYDVNTQDQDNASRLVLTDGEARGLAVGVSDAKYASQASKRLDLGVPLVKDTASAAGIGAALLAWFGRTRHVLSIDALSLARVPNVGERVYLKNLVQLVRNDAGEIIQRRHIPELADAYPFWLITEVSYEGENAQVVSLKLERQQDPVVDRMEMSPEAIPMGAVGLAVTSNTVSDFSDLSSLSGVYVAASTTPDLTATYGSATHSHSLVHTHNIASHSHGTTLVSVGGATAGAFIPNAGSSWAVGGTTYPSYDSLSYGPGTLFLAAPLTHSHTLSAGSASTASATGTSSQPTANIASRPGSNEPSHARVRFVQRTDSASATIDEDLVIGYESASIPAGWTRVTALDGRYLKGATANGAVSTTVATSTSYTPSDSGSTLTVASVTGITVGKLLQVGSGGTRVKVVVSAIAGTALTVVPVWESGDSGTTYSAGTSVTGSAETVGSTYDAASHDHGAVIPSHAHTGGGHSHGYSYPGVHLLTAATPVTSRISVRGDVVPDRQPRVAGDHQHIIYPTTGADVTVSGSAGGTISGATVPVPDAYSVVWIKPSASGLMVVPTGALMLWPSGPDAPSGWQVVSTASGSLLRGADAGQPASRTQTGHGHQMTPAAHTLSHQHGGTGQTYSEDAGGDFDEPDYTNGALTASAAAYYTAGSPYSPGHAHLATYTVASSDPGLSAATTQPVATVSGSAGHPLHKRMVLIRKV